MDDSKALPVVLSVNIILFTLLGVLGGAFAVALIAPGWVDGWLGAVSGPAPKVFWYMSRAAGLVSYGLVWLSVVLGLTITNRLARVWPGGPTVVDLHQFAGLLALTLIGVHVLVLLGDQYIGYTMGQLLVPFASAEYRPLWVGFGQLALYIALPAALTYYLRPFIGHRAWRSLHYGTFAVFVLATIHGLLAGTDGGNPLVLAMYAGAAISVAALTVYRIRVSVAPRPARA